MPPAATSRGQWEGSQQGTQALQTVPRVRAQRWVSPECSRTSARALAGQQVRGCDRVPRRLSWGCLAGRKLAPTNLGRPDRPGREGPSVRGDAELTSPCARPKAHGSESSELFSEQQVTKRRWRPQPGPPQALGGDGRSWEGPRRSPWRGVRDGADTGGHMWPSGNQGAE